jgi:hypothetical protein
LMRPESERMLAVRLMPWGLLQAMVDWF